MAARHIQKYNQKHNKTIQNEAKIAYIKITVTVPQTRQMSSIRVL